MAEEPTNPPSAEAEKAFAVYVARSSTGEEVDFESFCQEHSTVADELHRLRDEWMHEAAEQTLVAEGRLLPVVRLFAWLATAPDLEGVRAGAYGILQLDRARWSR